MRKKKKTEWSFARVAVFSLAVVLATILVGRIVLLNFPLDGHLRVSAMPGLPSPFFGGFRPENRTIVVPGAYAELKDEPIYFSLAVPSFFRTVTVRMEYRNFGQPVIELGAQSSHDEWAFMLKPIEADVAAMDGFDVRETFFDELAVTPPPETSADGWNISETIFDTGSLVLDERRDVQMVVSLPGMKVTDAPVLVRKVWIVYERPPITPGHLIKALRKRISL